MSEPLPMPEGVFTGRTVTEHVKWPGRPGMQRIWTVVSEPILASYGVWFVWASSPGMRDRPFHCSAVPEGSVQQ